jgi:hypothetical protein
MRDRTLQTLQQEVRRLGEVGERSTAGPRSGPLRARRNADRTSAEERTGLLGGRFSSYAVAFGGGRTPPELLSLL